jgi:O-antigen ligase
MSILMLVVFVALAIGGLFRPFIGLLGLLAVTMVNPGELSSLLAVLRLERVFVLISCLGLFLRPEKVVIPKLTIRLLIFWAAMFVTVPMSFWPGGSFAFAFDFSRVILYHFLTVNLVNTKERFLTFLVVYSGLVGWIAGGALYAYSRGTFDAAALRNGFERATGLTVSNGSPNALGTTLVVGLPVVVLMFLFPSMWKRLAAVAIVALSVAAVVLTGSRTSLVNLCTLAGGFLLSRRTIRYVPAVVIIALVTWTFMPQQYKNRYLAVADITTGQKVDVSYEQHRIAREIGLQMFLDYPLTGVGAGQFPIAAGEQYWPGRVRLWMNPHNLFIQLAAEMGILGVLTWGSFLWLYVTTLFRLNREVRDDEELPRALKYFPKACLFTLAGLIIAGLFGHNLYRSTWYIMAALAVSLDGILRARATVPQVERPMDSSLGESPSEATPHFSQ